MTHVKTGGNVVWWNRPNVSAKPIDATHDDGYVEADARQLRSKSDKFQMFTNRPTAEIAMSRSSHPREVVDEIPRSSRRAMTMTCDRAKNDAVAPIMTPV